MAKLKTGPRVKRKGGGVAAKAAKVDTLAERIWRGEQGCHECAWVGWVLDGERCDGERCGGDGREG